MRIIKKCTECNRLYPMEGALCCWCENKQLRARVAELEKENKKLEDACNEFIWGEDNPYDYQTLDAQVKQLRADKEALKTVIQNALVSLVVISMPIVGDPQSVASNNDLLNMMADSFKAALAEKEEREDAN